MIHARPTAADLPPAIRARVCNGIGPAYGAGWGSRAAYLAAWPGLAVARRVGLLGLYRVAGDTHDLLYAIGGTALDKRRADGLFLADLVDATADWPWALRWVGWAISCVFWTAVAAGGWGSWRWRSASPYARADGRPVVLAELIDLVAREAPGEGDE